MSYQNYTLFSAVIPSIQSGKDSRTKTLDTRDPANRQAVEKLFKSLK